MDFIVNATFKVSRQQVAGAMWRAFGSQITWFRVVEVIESPTVRFRAIEHLTLRMIDYPLNEGWFNWHCEQRAGFGFGPISLPRAARKLLIRGRPATLGWRD